MGIVDPSWRLKRIYSVVDKSGQRTLFYPNAVQRLINANPAKRKLVLKARQFGVSTNGIIDLLDHTIFNRDTTTCIIAHEQDSIKKLFRIATRAYEFLHTEFKPKIDRGGGSKYEMYFPKINSRIYCDLESRGDTIQRLHVSEAAFIKDPDSLKATMQAVPLNGRVTIETTPNGMGNHFYDLWNDPDQQYSKMFFPWFIFPEYQIPTEGKLDYTDDEKEFVVRVKTRTGIKITKEQIAFRRLKTGELKHLMPQEYPEDEETCFLATGSAAMDLFKVKKAMDARRAPIRTEGNVKIYAEYRKDRTYAMGADCAEGVEGDASVGVMLDCKTREEVAQIGSNSLKPSEFAKELNDLCMVFHAGGRPYPLLGVERNNHGHAVLLALDEIHAYPNIYYYAEDKPGWLTDKVTRPLMMDAFIEGVENGTCILHDTETFKECLTLIVDNAKAQAATGKHDDRVIASAIALQMCIECGVSDIYENIKDKILV